MLRTKTRNFFMFVCFSLPRNVTARQQQSHLCVANCECKIKKRESEKFIKNNNKIAENNSFVCESNFHDSSQTPTQLSVAKTKWMSSVVVVVAFVTFQLLLCVDYCLRVLFSPSFTPFFIFMRNEAWKILFRVALRLRKFPSFFFTYIKIL